MDNNLINFITKLSYKNSSKLKNPRLKEYDIEDVIQNSLLQIYQEGITSIEDNQLRINHIIVYQINLINNKNAKDYKIISKGIEELNEDFENFKCNYNKLNKIFVEFIYDNPSIKSEHLELFRKIKLENNKYKDVTINNGTNRKTVKRVMDKFKIYLQKKNIKLIDFYNEEEV